MRKSSLYASAKLRDYWIVNLIDRQLEVRRDPRTDSRAEFGASYADLSVYRPGDSVAPLSRPRYKIPVSDLLPYAGSFPLIPYPQIDPVTFQVGPLKMRWYGMAYLTGFVLAYLVLLRLVKIGVLRISKEAMGDLVGWLALGVVVGGRTGWWIFITSRPNHFARALVGADCHLARRDVISRRAGGVLLVFGSGAGFSLRRC